MTTRHCPDCLEPVAVRKPAQDGRCDYCRAQVGHGRRHRKTPTPTKESI